MAKKNEAPETPANDDEEQTITAVVAEEEPLTPDAVAELALQRAHEAVSAIQFNNKENRTAAEQLASTAQKLLYLYQEVHSWDRMKQEARKQVIAELRAKKAKK